MLLGFGGARWTIRAGWGRWEDWRRRSLALRELFPFSFAKLTVLSPSSCQAVSVRPFLSVSRHCPAAAPRQPSSLPPRCTPNNPPTGQHPPWIAVARSARGRRFSHTRFRRLNLHQPEPEGMISTPKIRHRRKKPSTVSATSLMASSATSSPSYG
jgi:hypothetical protein